MGYLDDFQEVKLYQPSTLKALCMKRLERNLHSLKTLGNAPFFMVESILRKCTAQQLERLEATSARLLPDSIDLWKQHCLNDFVELRRAYDDMEIDEDTDWRDLYMEKRQEREDKTKRLGERMKLMRKKEEDLKNSRSAKLLDKPLTLSKVFKSSSGWGKTASSTGKRTESSILSKARRDTKKYGKHFDTPAAAIKPISRGSGPQVVSQGTKRFAESEQPILAKRTRLDPPSQPSGMNGMSSSGSGASGQIKPAFKSKMMSKIARKF
ncbi:RNA polymerase II transcription factor SIII subunit A-domain-containing protein [Phlyctochytrium arcticum]|nr:RNA polymerase II transcription factor SIII subunit A-domain-containing protein [Phlyctochytrium arcticum]